MSKLIIGCHVSMSGTDMLYGSVKDALSFGANTFMFYTGAPQNTFRKEVSQLKVEEAKQLMKENNIDINNVVVHAPYIINLANTKEERIFLLAKTFLENEIQRVAQIGCKYLVLHPGSHVGEGEEKGMAKIIEGLNYIFEKNNDDVMILLETMAGKGSEIGYNFNHLKYIIDNVKHKDRLGVCLDTCHIFDAGYDIVSDLDLVIKEFDDIIGLKNLKVIHLNDSKNELNSKKDRHANIGKGFIGSKALKDVVIHPLLKEKIIILETPYIDDQPPYKKEIEFLRNDNC